VPLKLDDKKRIIDEVNATAVRSLSAVVAEYRGLTVSQMTTLRRVGREQGVHLRVVRNTLARVAVRGTEFECLEPALCGPVVLAFSLDDPGAAGRLVKSYSKEFAKLEVKALAVGGVMYPASDIERLASLPTRLQALGVIAGLLQAPVAKLARTLNEVPSSVARIFDAIKIQKQTAQNTGE